MYTDIYTNYRLFCGRADGIFGNSILRLDIFHFCGTHDTAIWISTFVFSYGVGCSKRTWAISNAGIAHRIRIDDGAQGKIRLKASRINFRASHHVGGSDVAAYCLRPIHEAI